MTAVLVTSTAGGTGKTAVALALATLARERGATVGYVKPKGTRPEGTVDRARDQDAAFAREALGLEADRDDLEPVVYSQTLVREVLRGNETAGALGARVEAAFERVAAGTDLVVLEGGDCLATGELVGLSDPAVAERLDAEVVLVDRYAGPDDVDRVLDAARRVGDRLQGVLYNDVPATAVDELTDLVVPALADRGVETLGVVPHDEGMAGLTVGELADCLGAEMLTPGVDTDSRVERFAVGATGARAALRAFRRTRNAAVITGGDRPDVQTAALEAGGVACLVLTGGYTPSDSVLARATDEGVPVLLVETPTRTAIDRTERFLRAGRTQRRETVDRMAEHLEARVDVDGVLDP